MFKINNLKKHLDPVPWPERGYRRKTTIITINAINAPCKK